MKQEAENWKFFEDYFEFDAEEEEEEDKKQQIRFF